MKNHKPAKPVKKRARSGPAKRHAGRRKAAPGTVAHSSAREDAALTLGAQCTLAEADSLKAELARRVVAPDAVSLDVGALQRIDTAALQLLAAFVRDRRTAGRAVQWRGHAAALEAAAALLGLKDMLELAGEVGR